MQHDNDAVVPNEDQEDQEDQEVRIVGNVILQPDEPDEPDESSDNGMGSRKSIGYYVVGIITIIFGIIVGIYLLVQFSQPTSTLFSQSKAGLTDGEFMIALGLSLLFVVPGVLCIGVGKIINLLN